MMKERNRKLNVDTLLVLVLFGVFALCALAAVLQGARIYRGLTQRGQESYNERTAAQYISARLHHADCEASVAVANTGSVSCLEFTETIDGEEYITRVYCYEGYIRELFSASSLEFRPWDGECIIPAREVSFSLENGLVKTEIVDENGDRLEVFTALRSGREGGNEK